MKLLCAALIFMGALPDYEPESRTQALVQCVEFPLAGIPRQLWERELVWMKNIGVGCVGVSDEPGLELVLSAARKLDLPIWVMAADASVAARSLLEPQTTEHGGPVRWIGRDSVPQPVVRISALRADALPETRARLEAQQGTILWTDVESTAAPQPRRGATSFGGDEQPSLANLRRELQVMQQWQPFLGQLAEQKKVVTATGALPDAVSARQLCGHSTCAVSIVNRSALEFRGEMRVRYPPAQQSIKLPSVSVPAGGALWLPINLPLAKAYSCANCRSFGKDESIVYATAELHRVEFENGILAFEFAARVPGEIILHLASEPEGPYLAAGKPRSFDWDAGSGRLRLPIPAGIGPLYRMRIGLALSAPETSAFFGDRKVLVIGERNTVSTSYSSESVAKRSRLLGPAWMKAEAVTRSPTEIDYSVTVPPSSLHGSHIELSLETDGARMSHARLQLLRPTTVRVSEAVLHHWGNNLDLPFDPPLVPIDRKTGRDLTITVRNHAPEIRTFEMSLTAAGFEFHPQHSALVIAAKGERSMTVRVFPAGAEPGLHAATLALTGATESETAFRLLAIPEAGSFLYREGAYTVLESQRARAVFSAGRWLEFVWKASGQNPLPEGGLSLGAAEPLDLRNEELSFSHPVPGIVPGKYGDLLLSVAPPVEGRAGYQLSRPPN